MPLYKAFNLYIRSEIDLPELILEKDQSICEDISILNSSLRFPELSPTTIQRRGVMAQSALDEDGIIYLFWEGIAGFKAVSGRTLFVDSYTSDGSLLSLFTVSEALGSVLSQRGLLLLHASSVQVGKGAYCFLGEPGAGKSTTASAFVKHGASLLSDDLTAIWFDDENRPYVLPAYPQLKIWESTVIGLEISKNEISPVAEGIRKFAIQPRPGFQAEPVPLSNVFLLHTDLEHPTKKRVAPTEVPIELIRHFPLPSQFLQPSQTVQRHFQQSIWCANSASIYYQLRPTGFPALEKWVLEYVS